MDKAELIRHEIEKRRAFIDSLQEEPVSEELEEKAAQLSQKYFPNEENIWARPNIEAQDCKNACIEMAKWQEKRDKEALNIYLNSQWNKGK